MKSIDMQTNVAYTAIKKSPDGTVQKGDIMWVSQNGYLNILKGNGFLLKDEWQSEGTVNFEVEESIDYYVEIAIGYESIRKNV